MSNTLIKFTILISLLCSFISCKKKRTCVCGSPTIESEATYYRDTKKNAEKKCKDREVNFKLNYPDVTCSIH